MVTLILANQTSDIDLLSLMDLDSLDKIFFIIEGNITVILHECRWPLDEMDKIRLRWTLSVTLDKSDEQYV